MYFTNLCLYWIYRTSCVIVRGPVGEKRTSRVDGTTLAVLYSFRKAISDDEIAIKKPSRVEIVVAPCMYAKDLATGRPKR